MPRARLAPRLWFEDEVRDKKTGRVIRQGVWCILDAGAKHRTGCGKSDSEGAGRQLQEYLTSKYNPKSDVTKDPREIKIADVLVQYAQERGPSQTFPQALQSRLNQLLGFWGDKTLSQISPQVCRDYISWRTSQVGKKFKPEITGSTPRRISSDTARRELTDLRSAINHHYDEGRCSSVTRVTMPEPGKPHADFLTRPEAARLLWAARTLKEEQGGRETRRRTCTHLVKFIILGLYTGSRHGTLLSASFTKGPGRSWIDVENGVFYRRPQDKVATNKRQPTIRLPVEVTRHLRAWKADSSSDGWLISWHDKRIASVISGFGRAAKKAGLGRKITPHILRHTCATWLLLAGGERHEVAGYLGMSTDMLEKVYGHHFRDHAGATAKGFKSKKMT